MPASYLHMYGGDDKQSPFPALDSRKKEVVHEEDGEREAGREPARSTFLSRE